MNDKWFLTRYGQPEQNIYLFKIKRQAKNVFPRDAERTVDWADAQAYQSLRWTHMPFCWFCQGLLI